MRIVEWPSQVTVVMGSPLSRLGSIPVIRESHPEDTSMTPRKLLLVATILAGLTGVAVVARKLETSGDRLGDAGGKFLASLNAEQKAQAAFKFDDKERLRWWFTPQQKAGKYTRKGLPLEAMTDEQKKLALEMLTASTSA